MSVSRIWFYNVLDGEQTTSDRYQLGIGYGGIAILASTFPKFYCKLSENNTILGEYLYDDTIFGEIVSNNIVAGRCIDD